MKLQISRTSPPSLLLASCFFLASLHCGQAAAFDSGGRWTSTQIDGGGLQRGDPVTLRWSVVPDGKSYDRSNNSQLIQFLDDGWNVPTAQRTPDFTNRAWWTVIRDAYAQYSRVTGIAFEYVPEQTAEGVSTGVFGDVRIGGENIDGTPGGALADNVYPNGGDMRIDTTRESNGSVGFYFSTEPGLRNLVIHETGHGVGLGHTNFVNNSAHAIMEGGLRTDIWGLQFDDVYALNLQYGDPNERNGGNDTPENAVRLGRLRPAITISAGLDAEDSVVDQYDSDWLGIHGRGDVDWFRITASADMFATIKLTPQGPTYETEEQGVFNAAAQSDLAMGIYSDTPEVSLIQAVSNTGVGFAEELNSVHLPAGDYLISVRVRGSDDEVNQFYRLDLTSSDLPLPGSVDLNIDGSTDAADWSIFLANEGANTELLPPLEAFKLGDIDQNGVVDFLDFRLFKSGYLQANGAAALASLSPLLVPEPATASMLFASLAALALFRKRS